MIKNDFQKLVDLIISKCIVPSLKRQGVILPHATLISKATRFCACEIIEGDYLEFGVYQGASLIASYHALKDAFESRMKQSGVADKESNAKRQHIWNNMRFFAFDSFEGLPSLETDDAGTADFKKGFFADTSVEHVKSNLQKNDVPLERVNFIEGWFSNTCTAETARKFEISKAAIIWIDSDLYSSARDVLNFVREFLQDGTILIFDDWFCYKGNPSNGEQRAFYEWIESDEIKNMWVFHEYQRESWARMAFIASRIEPDYGKRG
jgi:hypothetical protein